MSRARSIRGLGLAAAIVGGLATLGGCNALVGVEDVVAAEGSGGAAASTAASTGAGGEPSGASIASSSSSSGGGTGGDGGHGDGGKGDGAGGSGGAGGELGGGGTGGAGAACSDEAIGPGETDVDCGGPCPPCADDLSCVVPDDCQSGVCTDGHCAVPTCTDGVANGDETDIDCGVACSRDCHFGEGCETSDDCVDSATCQAGRCAPEPVGIWTIGETLPAEAPLLPAQRLEETTMVYDPTRAWTILYGGFNPPSTLNDFTWAYDGEAWFDLGPDVSPWPRGDAAAAYDRDRGRAVVVGGSLTRQTWEWVSDEGEWELVSDEPGPVPIRSAYRTIGYDEDHQVTVIYGGSDGGTELGLWNGEEWSFPGQGSLIPPGRYLAAGAWHRGSHRFVVFGGRMPPPTQTFLGDTWGWDGEGWTELAQENPSPSPRGDVNMVYDSQRDRLVLFGGTTESGAVAETWEFDGAEWLQITRLPSGQPPINQGGSMVYDEARKRAVMFMPDRSVKEYFTLATPCETGADCGSGFCEDHLCCVAACDDDQSCATEENPGFCEDLED